MKKNDRVPIGQCQGMGTWERMAEERAAPARLKGISGPRNEKTR